RQSLDPKWRIGGAVFDDTGGRLALEGAHGGAPLTDIYVLSITLSGNSVREKIIAGAGNRKHLGCVGPHFLPGGEQLLYFHNTRPDGAWELGLLDLTCSGDSAFSLEGRAPSVLALSLTDGAAAIPEAGIEYCEALGQAFFSIGVGVGSAFGLGSYLHPEQTDVPGNATVVVACDTAVALLAGIVIFPALFAFDIAPDFGQTLLIADLPEQHVVMAALIYRKIGMPWHVERAEKLVAEASG
ncbi:MAG TPA: hypothetical protein EYQ27_11555, partial [Gemmatimonadetes bacterium]|nr:hypothetical protein [Gemmatimonadota bacterium]